MMLISCSLRNSNDKPLKGWTEPDSTPRKKGILKKKW
jgi:hypothetical protein